MRKESYQADMATNGEVRCKKNGPKYVGPTSTLTIPITKRLFWKLMEEAKVDGELLQFFAVDLGSISEAERTIVKKASDGIYEIINSSDQAKVEYSVEDFKGKQWHIHSTNVHTEFNKVVKVTLADEVHWGRVISFLSFAVGFAVYVHRIGMPNSTVESIHGWTVQVLEHGIKDFFTKSGGWVSAEL